MGVCVNINFQIALNSDMLNFLVFDPIETVCVTSNKT